MGLWIVEFLNGQLDPAEVLAVEVRQYLGKSNSKIVVPEIIGRTVEAESKKAVRRTSIWNEQRFFAALSQTDPSVVPAAKELLSFGIEIAGRAVEWGSGVDRGSYTSRLIVGAERFSIFSVYSTAQVSLNLGWNNKMNLAGEMETFCEKYRRRFATELNIFQEGAGQFAGMMANLTELTPDRLAKFRAIISDAASEIRTRASGTT